MRQKEPLWKRKQAERKARRAKAESQGAQGDVIVAPIKVEGTPAKRDPKEPLVSVDDLRDEVVGAIQRSGMTYAMIKAWGGPTSSTLSKWQHRETKKPRLDTMRAAAQAVGYDIYVLPKARL